MHEARRAPDRSRPTGYCATSERPSSSRGALGVNAFFHRSDRLLRNCLQSFLLAANNSASFRRRESSRIRNSAFNLVGPSFPDQRLFFFSPIFSGFLYTDFMHCTVLHRTFLQFDVHYTWRSGISLFRGLPGGEKSSKRDRPTKLARSRAFFTALR